MSTYEWKPPLEHETLNLDSDRSLAEFLGKYDDYLREHDVLMYDDSYDKLVDTHWYGADMAPQGRRVHVIIYSSNYLRNRMHWKLYLNQHLFLTPEDLDFLNPSGRHSVL